MEAKPETIEAMSNFTEVWMKFAEQHQNEMHAGNWVHMFAVLTGTALVMADTPEHELPRILQVAADSAVAVFENAQMFINQTPYQ